MLQALLQRQSSEGGGPACSMAVLLLIGPTPIISLEHVANIEMFFLPSSPHSVLTSRCPDARRAKGHCCYRSSRVFSLDTLNWREKKLEIQQLAATRLCVPTFTVRGYLDFNTVTVIFYWDENIMFLRTAMTPDLWVTPCWVFSSAHLHGNTSST